jgi:archaellum component FlaC
VVAETVPVDAESQPATVGEMRSLRRWLIVTGVWALAATAIAVIALVVANQDDNSNVQQRTAGQIARVQRQVNDRIDGLESRMAKLPQSDDISKLENRLREVEDDTGAMTNKLGRLNGRIDDLESRVKTLEEAATTTGTETTETETTP